jgi:dTDP-glucose pyrophosphorylase
MTDYPLPITASLYDAVRAIEESRKRIAVVLGQDGELLGTLTDGDIRRCLLSGGSLNTAATEAMNPNPVTAKEGLSHRNILKLMKKANVMTLPVIDGQGRFKHLLHLTDLSFTESAAVRPICFYAAVIMAGGEGTRLRPLTNDIPKPMIKIGGIPLLERQINRLKSVGITRIYISVNYLSHVIEDHFGDGSGFGMQIEYIREKKKLGTAGALSLLDSIPEGPLLVMNGDILTNSDFVGLCEYHRDHEADITICAIDYNVQIPFGVLRSKGACVTALEEKPSQRFLCNAGIYSISPEIIRMIPAESYYNMTDLIRDCLSENRKVAVFPVHEFWSDIGTHDDLEKARKLFCSNDFE